MTTHPEDGPPTGTLMRLLTKLKVPLNWIGEQPLSAVATVIGIVVAVATSPFWLCLVIVFLLTLFTIRLVWFHFPVAARFPTISRGLWTLFLIICLSAATWRPIRDKYIEEYPARSIVYVVPGFWSPSPVARWFMMIQHCGPDPLYNVQIIFQDGDRINQISTHTTATPSEIAESSVTL